MDFQMSVISKKRSFRSLALAADVGGTKTLIGIFSKSQTKTEMVALFGFASRDIRDFSDPVNFVLGFVKKNYNFVIRKACIAVAAVISEKTDFAKTTNLKWDVSAKELRKKTSLKKIILVNDFEAMGFFINTASENDIVEIKNGKKIGGANMAVIGAGTGLGKCSLIYSTLKKIYVPLPSEAGHTDFAPQDSLEFELLLFIKRKTGTKAISYEHILSGKGIESIFLFLLKKNRKSNSKIKEILKSGSRTELISKYRKSDKTCKKTFEIFSKVYARFAKNCALDLLAYGGVYITAGIAQKNKDIFNSVFIKEFQNTYNLEFVLRQIPVYLITNKNAGLIGAGFMALREK
ncbi:MAG TPA: glucokinase [Candidatus Nanoarchaeia archaeon]|nr:glucokinase [Candidatus Nanoarchaeia archaeon]